MSATLWISVLALSFGLAYAIIFSEVTLALGRTLSDSGPGRGYQDALTPPWQARLSLIVYVLACAVVALSWFEFGVGRGLATVVLLFSGSLLGRRVLPQGHSRHYLRLIVRSRGHRYADWLQCGDHARASMMAQLLCKMGLDLPGAPRTPETSA